MIEDPTRWESLYQNKTEAETSWHEERPQVSLDLIAATGATSDAAIVDVGAGASRLVDCLLDQGFRRITVLDLSGVPSQVLVRLIGGILNITYEAMFWGRNLPEGGRNRPELVVMEEAHRYLGRDADNPARDMVQRIVKEGRKFGVGAMIVSQRPSEIDETILSQCGTQFALRLSNNADQGKVKAALPDSLSGLVDTLPVLRTGEAIIMGEAARLPIRCRINLPPEGERPSSADPEVSAAWARAKTEEDYERLAAAWRSQDPKWGQDDNTQENG